ncbi:MAG: hypothetical protein ABJA74_11355 [Lapillicoccus sp.]
MVPADACGTAEAGYPPRTANVSRVLLAFSVTSSHDPSGVNWIWAASVIPPAGFGVSGRDDPGSGERSPCESYRNPVIVSLPWLTT